MMEPVFWTNHWAKCCKPNAILDYFRSSIEEGSQVKNNNSKKKYKSDFEGWKEVLVCVLIG